MRRRFATPRMRASCRAVRSRERVVKRSKPPSRSSVASKASSVPTADWIDRIRVGTSSREALSAATGGKIERMGRRSTDDIFMLNVDGRRLVYARLQNQSGKRDTAYRTSNLHPVLDPTKRHRGRHIDHVGSTAIEGGRMGHRYGLLAMVKRSANLSAGSTNEKGPAPVREFNKVASAAGRGYASTMTREMQRKLLGRRSNGRGHSVRTRPMSRQELARFGDSLLQNPESQKSLAALAAKGRRADGLDQARKSQQPKPIVKRRAPPERSPNQALAAPKTAPAKTLSVPRQGPAGPTGRSGPSRGR